jgi:hypothetical protein
MTRVVSSSTRWNAGVVLAVGVAPGDALVGPLLGDLGLPLVPRATERGDPAYMRVVELRDLLDAVHEARELLELGPLVVDRAQRRLDLDRLLDRRHLPPPSVAWGSRGLTQRV